MGARIRDIQSMQLRNPALWESRAAIQLKEAAAGGQDA